MLGKLEEQLDAPHSSPLILSKESALYLRVTLRLIPFLILCYVVAYLDRINVGFAKLQMQEALNFSDTVYGLGAGIFFLGYFVFEVPSNLLLKRIGAKKTIARIMICWGIVGSCMAFVTTATEFYILRFLLGVFEAGFFPGVVYYISCWFPQARRGKILGLFMTGFPIAGMIGGPVSGWTMTHLSNVGNMAGWQWLFVVEACPAILLGIITLFVLDDDMQHAKWLTDGDRAILERELKQEHGKEVARNGNTLSSIFSDPKVYVMALAYFTFICGVYALSFWLPTMLKSAGVTSLEQIGWLAAIPFGLSVIGMVVICRNSDRTLERRWHTALCSLIGAAALALLPASAHDLTTTVLILCIASVSIFTTMPLFWAICSDYFSGSSGAAGGIAFVNSLGLIGGFVSPFAIGWIKTLTGSLNNGLYFMTALLVLGAVVLLIGVPPRISKTS